MKNRPCLICILFFIFSEALFCQETNYGPGYQTMIVNNPAFAGSNMDGTLRLSYLNFYPGNNYNFHSFFLSYDSYFQTLHGGAGFYLTNDYIGGIMNDLRGGMSYSYFLQAGKDLYINAGLSASFFNRGFNYSSAVFPDQIDPMGSVSLPTSQLISNENRTVFDAGTGFIVVYKNLAGGFALTHLTQPDLDGGGSSVERLKLKYLIHLIADFDLKKGTGLKILPLASVELQGKYLCAGAGAVIESNYMSVSSVLLVNNNKNIDVQAGFSIRREKLALFYNYRFNLGSGNSLIPFSVMHQTG
ncbi:MAG: type IX secretion system membrane protein PorP/SprF, partial [Bacteroidia bacterium]